MFAWTLEHTWLLNSNNPFAIVSAFFVSSFSSSILEVEVTVLYYKCDLLFSFIFLAHRTLILLCKILFSFTSQSVSLFDCNNSQLLFLWNFHSKKLILLTLLYLFSVIFYLVYSLQRLLYFISYNIKSTHNMFSTPIWVGYLIYVIRAPSLWTILFSDFVFVLHYSDVCVYVLVFTSHLCESYNPGLPDCNHAPYYSVSSKVLFYVYRRALVIWISWVVKINENSKILIQIIII